MFIMKVGQQKRKKLTKKMRQMNRKEEAKCFIQFSKALKLTKT